MNNKFYSIVIFMPQVVKFQTAMPQYRQGHFTIEGQPDNTSCFPAPHGNNNCNENLHPNPNYCRTFDQRWSHQSE